MTKRLDLIFNGKGGVGKSFFAVNFVQYLKDKNVQFVACDCDNENSTLKRFHGEEVQFLDLSQPCGLDAMIHALDNTDLVVVDCRAASTDVFFNYFDEIDLRPTLKDLSAALTLIMPTPPSSRRNLLAAASAGCSTRNRGANQTQSAGPPKRRQKTRQTRMK
jgi:cellulose biosynthesis protein BcsQ